MLFRSGRSASLPSASLLCVYFCKHIVSKAVYICQHTIFVQADFSLGKLPWKKGQQTKAWWPGRRKIRTMKKGSTIYQKSSTPHKEKSGAGNPKKRVAFCAAAYTLKKPGIKILRESEMPKITGSLSPIFRMYVFVYLFVYECLCTFMGRGIPPRPCFLTKEKTDIQRLSVEYRFYVELLSRFELETSSLPIMQSCFFLLCLTQIFAT